jgi:hypothetical protein
VRQHLERRNTHQKGISPVIDMSQRGYLSHILRKRRDFMQLVGIAIGLAFGVDLLASGLTKVLPIPMQTAVGGLTVLGVACVLGWWTFRSFSFVQLIEGCIFINSDLDTVCAVPQYAFSEDVASVLAIGLAASDSLRAHWKRGVRLIEKEDTEYPWLRAEALALVTDAIEIVLFDYLSTSLSRTLTRYRGDRRYVDIVTPADFPGMALGNVFMAADSHSKELRLLLPAGSGLIRPAPNVLVLYSPRFRLRIKIDYNGAAASLSTRDLAGNLTEPEMVRAHAVNIYVQCNVPLSALLQTHHWEHYRWLETFLERLNQIDYTMAFSAAPYR